MKQLETGSSSNYIEIENHKSNNEKENISHVLKNEKNRVIFEEKIKKDKNDFEEELLKNENDFEVIEKGEYENTENIIEIEENEFIGHPEEVVLSDYEVMKRIKKFSPENYSQLNSLCVQTTNQLKILEKINLNFLNEDEINTNDLTFTDMFEFSNPIDADMEKTEYSVRVIKENLNEMKNQLLGITNKKSKLDVFSQEINDVVHQIRDTMSNSGEFQEEFALLEESVKEFRKELEEDKIFFEDYLIFQDEEILEKEANNVCPVCDQNFESMDDIALHVYQFHHRKLYCLSDKQLGCVLKILSNPNDIIPLRELNALTTKCKELEVEIQNTRKKHVMIRKELAEIDNKNSEKGRYWHALEKQEMVKRGITQMTIDEKSENEKYETKKALLNRELERIVKKREVVENENVVLRGKMTEKVRVMTDLVKNIGKSSMECKKLAREVKEKKMELEKSELDYINLEGVEKNLDVLLRKKQKELRVVMERRVKMRLEKEKAEKMKNEKMEMEKERRRKEEMVRREKKRIERENEERRRREWEKLQREKEHRLEIERRENERLEKERFDRERRERERLELIRLKKELRERERVEKERIEKELKEKKRKKKEKLKKIQMEKEKLQKQLEIERLEKKKFMEEKEMIEREKKEKEIEDKKRIELEKKEREALLKMIENERVEKEFLRKQREKEKKKLEKQHEEQNKQREEQLEKERLKQEKEKLMLMEKIKIQEEKENAKILNRERLEREKLEKQLLKERIEKEKLKREMEKKKFLREKEFYQKENSKNLNHERIIIEERIRDRFIQERDKRINLDKLHNEGKNDDEEFKKENKDNKKEIEKERSENEQEFLQEPKDVEDLVPVKRKISKKRIKYRGIFKSDSNSFVTSYIYITDSYLQIGKSIKIRHSKIMSIEKRGDKNNPKGKIFFVIKNHQNQIYEIGFSPRAAEKFEENLTTKIKESMNSKKRSVKTTEKSVKREKQPALFGSILNKIRETKPLSFIRNEKKGEKIVFEENDTESKKKQKKSFLESYLDSLKKRNKGKSEENLSVEEIDSSKLLSSEDDDEPKSSKNAQKEKNVIEKKEKNKQKFKAVYNKRKLYITLKRNHAKIGNSGTIIKYANVTSLNKEISSNNRVIFEIETNFSTKHTLGLLENASKFQENFIELVKSQNNYIK